MTGIEELDAAELRAELTDATDHALKALDDLLAALDDADFMAAAMVAMKAKPWAHRVKVIRSAMRLEAAA